MERGNELATDVYMHYRHLKDRKLDQFKRPLRINSSPIPHMIVMYAGEFITHRRKKLKYNTIQI